MITATLRAASAVTIVFGVVMLLAFGAHQLLDAVDTHPAEIKVGFAAENGSGTLKPKIFSGPTDGNQAPKLEQKIADWLALNEKTIEVVNQTQGNCGMDTVITIWYRGTAKETPKAKTPTPGLHNLPGGPLPLDKESRDQKK